MAAGSRWVSYIILVVSMLVSLGLGASFILLRELCMSKRANDFVEEYCTKLADNTVRAAASVIVTIATLLIGFSLGSAICAFRTQRLEAGILEGAYVALGGRAWKYQVAAMLTPWRFVVAAVVLLTYGLNAFQPLLNQAQSSDLIYQKSPSEVRLDAIGVYSDTATFSNAVTNWTDTEFAGILAGNRLPQYGNGANSLYQDKNHILTTVFRPAINGKRLSQGAAGASGTGTSGLVFRLRDVFANVSSQCDTRGSESPAWDYGTLGDFLRAQTQHSSILMGGLTYGRSSAIALDLVMTVQENSQGRQIFSGVLKQAGFMAEGISEDYDNLYVLPTFLQCNFSIAFGVADAVININTLNVTTNRVYTSNSSISSSSLFPAVRDTMMSVLRPSLPGGEGEEALQQVLFNQLGGGNPDIPSRDFLFPWGLFERSSFSYMHSLVCSSVSVSLLGFYYSMPLESFQGTPDASVLSQFGLSSDAYAEEANLEETGVWNGNRYYIAIEALYSPVIRVFVSSAAAWGLAGALVGLNIFCCAIAIFFTARAKMNVKGAAENALFDNLTVADLQHRQNRQAEGVFLTHAASHCDLSNDEDAQRKHAFKTMLYYSEHTVTGAGQSMARVGFTQDNLSDPKVVC